MNELARIQIRKCHSLDEISACVALQKEIWNFSDAELMPLRLFVVAEKIGGQIIGGFDQGKLVGFALSLPGARGGHSYLHSQMLAVSGPYRDSGLGRQIKLFQREDALAGGFDLIEWTFDPLEIKNAYFNIARLGAVARRYHVNQYGVTSSPLQGGLPSDRLVAEWWLKSNRVESLLGSSSMPRFETLKTISVPAQIYEWKASEATRERAREVQECNRRDFLQAFSDGLTILGYERDPARNGKFLLGRWDERWGYSS
ncbi:MAG TPA: GNAT family N-acetyltransferase [Terriglobales bacterium]|jgi:predicted GNAT superfamily acetyltransferase|nr:GNAT family N-acetyltransferase [Terriglobales bacterium]